jgi:hypothetical protein
MCLNLSISGFLFLRDRRKNFSNFMIRYNEMMRSINDLFVEVVDFGLIYLI